MTETLISVGWALLVCFVSTAAIECGLMAARYRKRAYVVNCLLVNLLTNPLLNLILLFAGGAPMRWALLVLLECAAVWVEGFLYARLGTFSKTRAYRVALCLNLCSLGIGLAAERILQWM